ncbi:protein kinase G-activating protein GlnX [soil metagenome]
MSTTDDTKQIIEAPPAEGIVADQSPQFDDDDDGQAPVIVKNAPLAPAKKGKSRHRDVMGLTTPHKLSAFLIVICMAAFCCGISGWSSVNLMRETLTDIGKHAIPSSLCVEEIRALLTEMNTNAIDEFLARTESGQKAARIAYRQNEDTVTGLLVAAASDVTYGAQDMAEIKAILGQIHEYIGLIEIARAYNDMHSELAPQALIHASDHMQHGVLKLVDALNELRRTRLIRLYEEKVAQLNKYIQFTFGSGLILLSTLVLAQVYTKHKTRRFLNLSLVFATVACLSAVVLFCLCMKKDMASLTAAKSDVYDKMIVLWQVRSTANDANGLESLYLVGSEKKKYADAFQQKIESIRRKSVAHWSANVFAEKWDSYLRLDAEIRALETSGKHDQAIDLCLGTEVNQSERAFKNFNDKIAVFLETEQSSLQVTIDKATNSLKWMDYGAVLLAFCIPGFAWLGLRARLKEYGW